MRYFKYTGPWADIASMKRRYEGLSAENRRQRRKAELLHKLGTVVFWLVFLVIFLGGLLLGWWLLPEPDSVFWGIIGAAEKVAIVILSLVIGAILGSLAAAPLWVHDRKAEKAAMQQILSSACRHLREYYQLQDPFLVTKCYRSSDRRFDRHDVCIFIVGQELRITANLHYGFFHPKRDLGCYGLTRQEISLCDAQYKDRAAVELRAGELTFCLGAKAKPFIESYL